MFATTKKAMKNAVAFRFNKAFNSECKNKLFELSNCLEGAAKEAGSPVVFEGRESFVYISNDFKMIYIILKSGSRYGFGIDTVRTFGDFTEGFSSFKKEAIEQAVNEVLNKNEFLVVKDINRELNLWHRCA